MKPEFKTCPHCGTEGILIMADGRCPHCKKLLLVDKEQLIDSQNALKEKERSGLESTLGGSEDSTIQGVSPSQEEEISPDIVDHSSEPDINKNNSCADSDEIKPHIKMITVSEVKPSAKRYLAPMNAKSTNQVKQKINQFVNELKIKEKRYQKVSTYIGVGLFILTISAFVFLTDLHIEDWKVWLVLTCFLVGISFAIGYTIFWLFCCPVIRRIGRSYINEFPAEDIRLEADKILYSTILNIETLPRLKRFIGVITSRFVCLSCWKAARFNEAGNLANCKKCKSLLVLPVHHPPCPFCGKKKTIMVTPEEQIAPIRDHQGVVAGSLKYGPAGILAGGIMDAIYRPFKLAFRSFLVSTKRHRYECKACYKKWAIPLKVANAKKANPLQG